jgi:hypothetical protein
MDLIAKSYKTANIIHLASDVFTSYETKLLHTYILNTTLLWYLSDMSDTPMWKSSRNSTLAYI